MAQPPIPPAFPRTADHLVLPRHFGIVAARQLLKHVKAIPARQLPRTLRIDCSQTEAIDSAGLGSLLLIGEYLGAERSVVLEGAQGPVLGLIQIARIEERLASAGKRAPLAADGPSLPLPSGDEQLAGAPQR